MLGAAAGTLALLGRSLFDASRHLLARGLTFGYEEAFRDDFASLHGSALVADGLLIAMPVCVATALAAIAPTHHTENRVRKKFQCVPCSVGCSG